jgi:RNA polymerase sigma-70 factor (ECF subfamily)
MVEAELIAAARAGREEAWAQLHREHFPRLWNSVNRIVQNPSLTDDIVQEAFVKAFREIARFEGNSQFGTWLYRIGVNKALDAMRRDRRRERWLSFFSPKNEDDETERMPDLPVEPEVTRRLEALDERTRLQEAMKGLSAEHRAVVQLRLIDELSLEEAARLLRVKPGTVNSRLHYACAYLRKKLKTRVAQ